GAGGLYQVPGQRTRCASAVPPTACARTPFVGRAQELATLHAVWADVIQGQGHVVGVVGEAGMGKSRLVAEFRRSLRHASHTYVQGHCVSYDQTMAYQPVLALLRHACGLTASDRPAVMAAKVQRRLQEVGMDPAVAAPSLLHLLGSDSESARLAGRSPEEYDASTFAMLMQWSLHSSQPCPLVIAVEDLHWGDATSEGWL